jgi:hypothetical protein
MDARGSVIREWIDDIEGHVELSIFGTTDAGAIADAVDAFCLRHLGVEIDRYTFYRSSIGSVHGIELADGRRVVVKAHQPEIERPHLEAMSSVQRHLADGGFPCPRPVLPPRRLGHGFATIEEELSAGHAHDGHDPAFRRAMARSLADLVQRCRPFGASEGILMDRALRVPNGRLWPTPHARIFDFDATGRGAERIDEVAAAARAILDRVGVDEPILGHTDWRAENLRFDGQRVSAVFDWESLLRTVEPVLVGEVVHAFPSDWSRPSSGRQAPSLEEVREFVTDYEDARGHGFEPRERTHLGAGYAYATAYTARCEHALDPEAAGEQREGFWTLVHEHGIGLLNVLLDG